ncbi:MAG: vanadium-dependent haloperoxidase [Bacteroidota bacterium]
MQIFKLSFVVLGLAILASCGPQQDQKKLDEFSKSQHTAWNKKLTSVVIRDIFTPPVCSRIYAYPNIAAYEALVPGHPEYVSLSGQLNELKDVPKPDAGKEYYLPLSSMIAFATVAEKLVISIGEIQQYQADYLQSIEAVGIKKEVLANSVEYGKKVGAHILAWANTDRYRESKAMSRYVLTNQPGEWQPTPPDYMPAVEPHWSSLRTFVMDSASHCRPVAPTSFDTVNKSKFYEEALEVVETVKSLTPEQLAIAKFWDCNPNVSVTKGHATFFNQKISPGGHWMGIAGIAAKNKNMDLMQTAETYALVSISLAEGFISCWSEKYKIKSIRPETYIEQYIDANWDPILQTPPFPEFPSGHSVISSAAATALTYLVGDSFAYTDSLEVEFGMPARNFNSFYAASEEAAISRLYGGIHFRPAITYGAKQGKMVGECVLAKIKTRKNQIVAKR